MKKLRLLASLMALLLPLLVAANGGYRISVEVSNYDGTEAYLAYYLGPGQYVQDTVALVDGAFEFSGEEKLAPGFYLVVFPPKQHYFQVLIADDEQQIAVKVDGSALQKPTEVTGSHDTELFYEYAEFLAGMRPEADKLRAEMEAAVSEQDKEAVMAKQEALNDKVEDKQARIIKEYPDYLTTMLIKAHKEFVEPEFEGSEEEVHQQTYDYYRKHYFDNVDLADPRIVRTPFVHEKINYYLEKLTYQQPDSLNQSLDYILGHFDPESEAFQVYLVHFLNTYAKSKIVGMDAVYVHLVDTYYASGQAEWTDEKQLKKIVDNADRLRPILIGKTAPNLILDDENKKTWDLHGINADYTVLFFWDPDCGHCKKSVPHLIEFYENYKDRGIEIYAVCTKLKDGVPECWETIKEKGMDKWINVADPYLRSRYKQIYDVRVTPQIFVLNQDNVIVMKKIGAEQLPGVMDHLLGAETTDE